MPKVHHIQVNFTGGQFSPKLEGRLDLPRYANAVRVLKNMTVMPQGGTTRRWGFHLADETKYSTTKEATLIPFIFSEEISYILEFGNLYMRVYEDGYLVHFSAGKEKLVNGDFTYDIGYWGNVSTGTGTAVWNTAKARLAGGAGGVGAIEQAISVKTGSAYTITFDVFTNSINIRIGTTSSGQEILADATKAAGSHVVIFTATADTVYIGFRNSGNNNAEVDNASCREGTELITNPTMNTNITGYTDLSTGTGSISAVGGAMALAGGVSGVGWAEESVTTSIGVQYCITCDVADKTLKVKIGTTTGGEQILVDTTVPVGIEEQIVFTATTTTTYIGFKKSENETSNLDNVFVRTWNIFEIETPYIEEDLPYIRTVQYSDTVILVNSYYPQYELWCGGDLDWELDWIEFIDGPYLDEDTDITITTDATAIGASVNLVASEPLFNLLHEGALWRLKNVATWGYVEITTFTDSTHAVGIIRATLGAAGPTVAQREGAWSDYRGYPSTVSFFEDRIIYGGTISQPQTKWGSKSGEYNNFTPGVLDSDPFTYTVASNQMNKIEWIQSIKDLLIGTMGGEFSAKGGADNPITPTNIQIKSESNYGSENIQPARIGNAILFVQRGGRKIREFSFNWESDTYVGQDISIVADDLTEAGIVKLAYQQEPDSVLWAQDSKGGLLGVTYERLHDAVAWHYHPTDGVVKDVAVIPNALRRQDELWAIIKRTIGGVERRFVEYLDPDLNTDSALVYVGSDPVTAVGGLDHLIGKTVDILGDFAVYPQQVVDANGEVTLQESPGCTYVEVGLHYESEVETLRPEAPIAGTSQGIPKHWSQVNVRLYKSIGCTIGGEMIPFRTPDDLMGEGIDVFTGDKRVSKLGWDKDGRITIKQTQPLPLTILSIFGVLDIGD